jgi:hypothetical protein
LSSLAFGRECDTQLKIFSVKGFAGGRNAARYSGSAAAVTGAISIAATVAATKRAGSSVERRTVVIAKLQKGGWTSGIVSGLIGAGWLQPPLWIKVPSRNVLLARSPWRHLICRSPLKTAANQETRAE